MVPSDHNIIYCLLLNKLKTVLFPLMISKMCCPNCLILTTITRIMDTNMARLVVSVEIIQLCSLIITTITRIPDTIMNRFFVPFEITQLWSLIITTITRISNTIMNRFLVSFETSQLWSLNPISYGVFFPWLLRGGQILPTTFRHLHRQVFKCWQFLNNSLNGTWNKAQNPKNEVYS